MTRTPDIEVLHHARDRVGEGPLWVAETGCLWWVDIDGKAVRRCDVRTGDTTSFEMAMPPAALALHEDGSLVLAAGTGFYRMDPAAGALKPIVELPDQGTPVRMNDGATDPAGRFWAGTMSLLPDRAPVGRLFRLDGDRATEVLDGLRTQNGAAVSPDGRTFYLADSHPQIAAIWAFDLEIESGALTNRRLFHKPARGRPDGAAIDADGCYWFAAVDGGVVVQVDPDGREIRSIPLPVTRPTKPAFGGPDLSTLYVTTMRNGLDEAQQAAQPLAGAVLALDPGVRGWPQPRVRAAAG